MRRSIFIFPLIFALALSFEAKGRALEGTPKSVGARGDAFVEAWLTFRLDLDSLSGLRVHPDQYAEWFDQMPEFLLRDAARLATNHDVLVSATSRLADIGGQENQALIRQLAADHKDRAIEKTLKMHLVKAKDRRARSEALRDLNHPVFQRRLDAAIVLAGAGVPKGVEYLRSIFKKEKDQRALAALVLGRYGGDEEARFLADQVRQHDGDATLRIAKGEMLQKKHFPAHHRAFVSRFPLGQEISPDGIYEAWLMVIEHAISKGARSSTELLKEVKAQRLSPPKDVEPDLFKRQMVALQEFWTDVDNRIAAGPRFPLPRAFDKAMAALRNAPGRLRDEAEPFIGPRVSASIAVLSALGDTLGYAKLAGPTTSVNAVTPLGERALDGNLATSWPVRKGSTLVLEHLGKELVDTLYIMLACPTQTSKRSVTLTLSGSDWKSKPWKRRLRLKGSTRYFQKIPIHRESAGRISVSVTEVENNATTCVAELRLQFR